MAKQLLHSGTLLGLAAAGVFLAGLSCFAPPAATDGLPAAVILPASSPYGEARAITNIPYAAQPASRQNFDLYLPGQKKGPPCPLIIWIHGGAWKSGFKDWDNVKYLVRRGYAIASIDYRFCPEFQFPAQIEDCNAAMNFILAHASEYGVDGKRFVVAGASAGGHLALLLGLARAETHFGAEAAIRPLAIIDFFGPTDFNKMLEDLQGIHSQPGLNLLHEVGPELLGTPVEQPTEQARIASPINYVSAASPPVLILQGGRDELVPAVQSRRLQKALEQAGVKNQLVMVDDAGHDGPAFETPAMQAKVVGFLKGIFAK
ncbi:MAG TPA: alpha/beta hydrolase [Candidatus Acidoferrales bacterium]|nr:alpha/beta hydrolase [Candidatus Acidoferrales bacterium]